MKHPEAFTCTCSRGQYRYSFACPQLEANTPMFHAIQACIDRHLSGMVPLHCGVSSVDTRSMSTLVPTRKKQREM